MRTIKIVLLALILIGIVLLALANRQMVTLQLLPTELTAIGRWSIEMPLFLVGLVSVLTGMVLGYILEWLREHKHRRVASQKTREAAQLNREVGRLRREGKPEDDVLALLGN